MLRVSDRLGRIVLKVFAWIGDRLLGRSRAVRHWVADRFGYSVTAAAADREAQIGSLTGLIVFLLAASVTILLWSTNPQATNPVIRFFSVGGDSQGGGGSPLALAQGEAQEETFLASGGAVVFAMPAGAQEDIFAIAPGMTAPQRLTAHPADDRDPAISPDGQRVAFASRRDGNWELYVMALASGQVTRLTYDLAYEAAPTWSPDGQWLAYESYYGGSLDIYIIRADASEGPYPVTTHPGPEFSPAWTTNPSGRQLAYVALRDGQQDIYVISLDDPSEERALNVTATPGINEGDPEWSPDGARIAYTAVENGIELIYVHSLDVGQTPRVLIGQGRNPSWSPDGGSLVFISDRAQGSLLLSGQYQAWNNSVQAFDLPARASHPDWSLAALSSTPRGELAEAAQVAPRPAYEETISPEPGEDAPYLLFNLPGVVTESPYLSDRVDSAFNALREYTNQAAGWDFLGRLDDVWWPIDRRPQPGEEARNWHMAGRAFSIVQAYNQGNPPQVEVVRRAAGPDVTWEVFVRASLQDGSLGEPMRDIPWDFNARASGDPAAYEAGGRLKEGVPAGYYINFTDIARRFGWYPVASDLSWRYNWPGVRYWQFEKQDGLDWWEAMLEIYAPERLEEQFGSPASPGRSGGGA